MNQPAPHESRVEPMTFPDWLQAVYIERFTGCVLVHFGQGVANEVHVLSPEAKIRLDKQAKRR